MAVNIRQRLNIGQAKAQRLQMPRYLRLDGGRYLITAALLLSLMSLLTLGQTGRLATKGYQIGQLERQRTLLLRERSAVQIRLAEAQAIDRVMQRATGQGLHPMTPDQARYLSVGPLAEQPAPPLAIEPPAPVIQEPLAEHGAIR